MSITRSAPPSLERQTPQVFSCASVLCGAFQQAFQGMTYVFHIETIVFHCGLDPVARRRFGVEAALEDVPGADELWSAVCYAVHHRVLAAMVHEDGSSGKQFGEVEARCSV